MEPLFYLHLYFRLRDRIRRDISGHSVIGLKWTGILMLIKTIEKALSTHANLSKLIKEPIKYKISSIELHHPPLTGHFLLFV